jgi:EmrB/QacA subfamily drug resistance transporter
VKDATMTTPAATAPSEAETIDPKRWLALACLLVGSFLAPLDFFIVNVAMPAMTTGLKATAADVQLVISGYAVVYAVFLITGGRLGDIYGRKSVFLAGLIGFALASAFCGLAWSPSALVLGRLLQALAAAAMAPQALASIHALFPPRERGRALSIYGITLGFSSVIGQLLGGALVGANVDGLGWRLIFLINVPIVVVAAIATLKVLRETRSAMRPRLDLGGVVLSCAALTTLVLPLVEGRERGWPWWSIVMLLTTPFFVEAFRRYEIRLAKAGGDPLVAIEIFQSRGLLRGLSAIIFLYAIATFFLVYSIYLQTALGLDALQAGLGIIPFSIGFVTGSTFMPLFGRWLGTAATSLGFCFSTVGAIATALVAAHFPVGVIPPWMLMGPAVMFIGLGMGTSIPTMMRAIVERVEPRHAGLVSGVVNSTLQVSAAVGIAILGGLFYTVAGPQIGPASVTHAFSITLLGIAACHICGAILAAGLGQRRHVVAAATTTATKSVATKTCQQEQ